MKKLNLILFAICFLSFQLITAQTPNWIGGTGDWDNPANWVGSIVPTATTDVLVNAAGSDITIPNGVNAVCRSVIIFDGTLTLNETATLTISNSISGNGFGLQVGGAQVGTGNFINHGNTSVINPQSSAMRMTFNCNFHNTATGTFSVDGGSYGFDGLDLGGTILNEGTFNITNTSLAGLRNVNGSTSAASTITNATTGTINISNTGSAGIFLRNGNIFENNGSVNLGTGIGGVGVWLQENGFFNNTSTGQVNIMDAGVGNPGSSIGIGVTGGAGYLFTNDGFLCIDENNVTDELIASAVTFTNNGVYNTSGCSPSTGAYYAIPTMGEWSLIIFGLIILSLGVMYVLNWKGREKKSIILATHR